VGSQRCDFAHARHSTSRRIAGRHSGAVHAWSRVVSKSDRHQKVEDRDPKRAVGFAERPVLPGEDQEEFDALREELYLEYEPQGPAEEDAVETIAEAPTGATSSA
jgi:hypothetical protein